MKNSQLDRLLRFAQRTGDRLIITDSEGKQPVVILSLDEYEALLDGRRLTPRAVFGDDQNTSQEMVSEAVRAEAAPEPTVIVNDEFVGGDVAEATSRPASEEPQVIPITRKSSPVDAGEEQFYMESI